MTEWLPSHLESQRTPAGGEGNEGRGRRKPSARGKAFVEAQRREVGTKAGVNAPATEPTIWHFLKIL